MTTTLARSNVPALSIALRHGKVLRPLLALPSHVRNVLSVLLLGLLGCALVRPAAASLLDDWTYETVPPVKLYAPYTSSQILYPTADLACAQLAGSFDLGQVTTTYSEPRAAFHPAYGFGCEFRLVYTQNSTGNVTDVFDPWFAQHWVDAYAFCPADFTYISGTQLCRKPRPPEECNCPVSNPIYPGRGTKYQVEQDLSAVSRGSLAFARQYSSWHFEPYNSTAGRGWFIQPYGRYLKIDSGFIVATRALGTTHAFELQSSAWNPKTTTSDTLVAFSDGLGSAWRYYDSARQAYEFYDSNGVLLRIEAIGGGEQLLRYSTSSTPTSIAPHAGLLIEIENSEGAELHLIYNAAGRLVQMVDPAGQTYSYAYGNGTTAPADYLVSVQFPDTSTRQYLYEPALSAANYYNLTLIPQAMTMTQASSLSGSVAPLSGTAADVSYTSPVPLANYGAVNAENQLIALTGITDEGGNRYATWKYDAKGRAIETTHALNSQRTVLTYTGANTVQVETALGEINTFNFSTQSNRRLLNSISGNKCTSCGEWQSFIYNADGTVYLSYDWNAVATTHQYDSRQRETSRTDAQWWNAQRTVSTQWHSTFNRPIQVDEWHKRTTFTYDAAGNPLTRTQLDTTTSQSRTWTYTYNSLGRILTADGPRSDVSDLTTYTYYNCTGGAQCGQIHTITNAAGHITTYNTYNAHGQPLTLTDPNGVVTTLTYDLRQRLTSRTTGTEQSTFTYWPTGLLKKATLPDGSYLEYTYDAAHRLTAINDAEGNRISYTLDAMSNRTAEQLFDPSNALAQTRTRVFNTLNRLQKELGAAGTVAVTTEYGYDNNGNQTSVSAPLSRNSTQSYDELNRLKSVTDPLSGITQYGYNALDQLISVTDPRSKVTSYTYNALGDLTQQVSPDTGTTVNTYDSGGNLKTRTDARSKVATYSYDALNRVTGLSYPDQTIAYTYDVGTNAKGRLSSVADASGSSAWSYDGLGRVTSHQQTIGSLSKTTSYSFNSAGQLQSMTLPSGNVVSYGYQNGKPVSLTLNGGTTILSTVLYQPFGPTAGWTWGNSTLAVREYDTDGKVTDIDSAGLKSYGYDDAFRITGITDATNSALSQSYGYDLLDRLTGATGTGLNQSWTYDANGNRLTQGGSAASTFTIASTSNRLSSVSGSLTRTYAYDAAGNTTGDGTATYTYDDAGRMVSATKGGVTGTYSINALGQRVRKTVSGTSTYFAYDEAGHLIGEYDGSGNLLQETIWLGDMPVAVIKSNGGGGVNLFYVHTDHLNTPRRISRPSDDVVIWRWDSDPFGTTQASEDPDGDSASFGYNLRFPGQYYDAESGLNYNYFRDYDPATGRYVQSDPIGIKAGPNTYAYVDADPISSTDPTGLIKWQGSVTTGAFVNRYGGAFFHFNLKSECKCGIQIEAEVNALAAGGGPGKRATISYGSITLNDDFSCPDSEVLAGWFAALSAGVTFGGIPIPPTRHSPSSRIGPGLPGAGIGISKIVLGGAISEALPPGWIFGRDASASAMVGRSWYVSEPKIRPCCDK